MGASNINSVRIAIPNQFDGSHGMRPAEIKATDARPVRGEIAMLASNRFLGNREDSAAPEAGRTVDTGIFFPFGIARSDFLALLRE